MNRLMLDAITIALGQRALLAISARVEPGETLTVMGPSGSGKSTLLAYIGGFLAPEFAASGRVFSGDVELTKLPAEDRHAGLLFQDPLLFPHMSVAGNVAFALPARIKGHAVRLEHAEAALADVGLASYGDRDPATLSGGQKARVALARTLVSEPRMMLLDEPFSKLDADLRAQIRDLVFAKARAAMLPVILVTHDEADANAAGGQVVTVGEEA
ncbi:ATP-binding cassette domain-containing protein [Aliihoeflea sp. 40Bstr573]|uniref:ATP-binding cassette domain-containing protein n=1 Tax=Aliihoeflea sp. 40Bstr573 TaxID=2696467 RepID=UPI0020951F3A|nr:ATP-binding cassette domain-containing protein [Aliihoeflea sp. 40Bstr573]MCO6387355.1 ATP-binding cassette domain-containing protein [Aliihoeflea sp. 40Bstr573]